jgi:hypothetical protein
MRFAGNTTVVSGNISTMGDSSPGIEVYAHGPIDITSGNITILGNASSGIIADSDLSAIAIHAGDVSVGDGDGISATATTGAVSVSTTGSVTSGGDGSAIRTFSGAGNTVISLNGEGSVISGQGNAAFPVISVSQSTGNRRRPRLTTRRGRCARTARSPQRRRPAVFLPWSRTSRTTAGRIDRQYDDRAGAPAAKGC